MERYSKKDVLVSIWCITYNHAPYIRDAIEGFLSQKTSFKYEIVIHDDASTDGTTDILKEYESKYPSMIKVIYQKKNTYRNPEAKNIRRKLKEEYLKGKYIALCEGDDYWIDSSKLQKQVDYLESHKDCVMVAHNAIVKNMRSKEERIMNIDVPTGDIETKDIILQKRVNLPTASLLYRRDVEIEWGGFFTECGIGDYPFKLYCLSKGQVHYLKDSMSVYRFMCNGSWSATVYDGGILNITHYLQMIVFLQKYDAYTNSAYKRWIKFKIFCFVRSICVMLLGREEEESEEICEAVIRSIGVQYKQSLDVCKKIQNNIKNHVLYTEGLKEFCDSHKQIWIWGTGKYSERYSKYLESIGVEILGYIVSQNTEDSFFNEKRVYSINEYYEDLDEVGIVVASSVYVWPEIHETMMEHGVKNYYCAYELQYNNVFGDV